MGRKKTKIPGARRLKGRLISGHALPLEQRTWQETQRAEAIDRVLRLWRPEPQAKPRTEPELHRLLRKIRGVDTGSLPMETSHGEPRRTHEPQSPKGPEKTVEQRLGGWIYTVAWPSGEILDKRKEV